jgi:flagellar basal body-associated protein FliL
VRQLGQNLLRGDMAPPKLRDLERAEAVKRSKKVLLIVGIAAVVFMALVAAAFYFHIFNLANVVNGNG